MIKQTKTKAKAAKKKNTPMQSVKKSSRPANQTPQTITIRNRELVASLANSGTAFQLLGASSFTPGYDLNPCNSLLFPWLSTVASAYEKYHFTSLGFHLVTGAASTTSGRLYMAFDYDYDDSPPVTLSEMSQAYGMVAGSVREDLRLAVNINMLNSDFRERFNSPATSLNGVEPRTVYGGFLSVASAGVDVNASYDLFVEYTVILRIPQFIVQKLVDTPGALSPCYLDVVGNSMLAPSVGKVPKAIPGTEGNPILPADGLPSPPNWALDIRQLTKGLLQLASDVTENTGSPSLLCDYLGLNGQIYDDTGATIGSLSQFNTPEGVYSAKAKEAINQQIGGATVNATASIALQALKSRYPRAAYIAPYLYNGVAKFTEIGNKADFQAKLEL